MSASSAASSLPARIQYFDIARGIAILMVILSHSILTAGVVSPQGTVATWVFNVCFSFHMPLFFILSGYFMHLDRGFRWGKEIRELLGTYAITAAVVVIGVAGLTWARHLGGRAALKSWLSAAIYGAGDIAPNALWPQTARIGAIWFLLALFWAHLLMHAFARLPITPLWVAVCFAVGYVSARWIWLPFDIQSGMCAVLFVYAGYLAKRYQALVWLNRHPYVWVVPAAIWFVAIWKFSGLSLAMNQYGATPVLAVLGGFAGTVCVVGVSMVFDRWGGPAAVLLAKTGQVSLALLCAHLIDDNIMPWIPILARLHAVIPAIPLWIALFVLRLVLDAFLAVALWHLPKVSLWFYPMKAKARCAKQA